MSLSGEGELHPETFYDIQDDATWAIIRLLPVLLLCYAGSIALLVVVGLAVSMEEFTLMIDRVVWYRIVGGAAGAGVLLAVGHALFAYLRPIKAMVRQLHADPLDDGDHYHRTFQNVVDEITLASPVASVEARVIPSARRNAMAMGDSEEAVIVLTEGALGCLRRDELQAVVAHEMAHVAYGDARLKYFTANLIQTFDLFSLRNIFGNKNKRKRRRIRWGGSGRGNGRAIIALVVVAVLSRVLKIFNRLLSTSISQQREWRADATAVEYCRDPEALASALYKLGMLTTSSSSLGRTSTINSTVKSFQEAVDSPAMESLLLVPFNSAEEAHQSMGWLDRFFQAHPPLYNRIEKCLNLAHTSYSNLRQRLKRKRSSPHFPIRAMRDPDGHLWQDQPWFIHDDGETRQVSLASLLTGGIVDENKPVARGGDDDWKPPDQHAELKTLRHIYQTGEEGRASCPDCGVTMRRRFYLGVPLEACVLCGGVGLPWKKLVRVESRYRGGELPPHIENFEDYHGYHGSRPIEEDEKMEGSCPHCRADFRAKRYRGTGLVVDRCGVCKLTWFEEDELVIALALLTRDQGPNQSS